MTFGVPYNGSGHSPNRNSDTSTPYGFISMSPTVRERERRFSHPVPNEYWYTADGKPPKKDRTEPQDEQS